MGASLQTNEFDEKNHIICKVQCHLIGAADQEVKCFQDTQWGEHPSARQCTVRRKQLPAMAAAYLGADHNHHADHNKHLPRGQSLAEGVGHHHFTISMWTLSTVHNHEVDLSMKSVSPM